jgi:hypothetical protein
MVINFIGKVLSAQVDHEVRERIIIDVSQQELQRMHQDLYKKALDEYSIVTLFPTKPVARL